MGGWGVGEGWGCGERCEGEELFQRGGESGGSRGMDGEHTCEKAEDWDGEALVLYTLPLKERKGSRDIFLSGSNDSDVCAWVCLVVSQWPPSVEIKEHRRQSEARSSKH